jgi:hypothetical protein
MTVFFASPTTNCTAFNWQSGPLGNYYLPSDSLLIATGNTTADQLGLSAFTTQTNQVPEGTALVDIGYHYMACFQSACISEAGGELSLDIQSLPIGDFESFAVGVPVSVSAAWTDVPGVEGVGGFDSSGNWVMTWQGSVLISFPPYLTNLLIFTIQPLKRCFLAASFSLLRKTVTST